MNQLKRTVLMGVALGLVGATGVALAQSPEAAPAAAPQPAARTTPAQPVTATRAKTETPGAPGAKRPTDAKGA